MKHNHQLVEGSQYLVEAETNFKLKNIPFQNIILYKTVDIETNSFLQMII
jgi:hypothetical protein